MKKVTIIDDSELISGELHRHWADARFTVKIQAITSWPFFDQEIEESIARFQPHLIILDILLSDDVDDVYSGFMVLRAIKDSELLREIPVVMLSKFIASEGGKYVGRAKSLGALDALPKFPMGPTAEKIRTILTSRESDETVNVEAHNDLE